MSTDPMRRAKTPVQSFRGVPYCIVYGNVNIIFKINFEKEYCDSGNVLIC